MRFYALLSNGKVKVVHPEDRDIGDVNVIVVKKASSESFSLFGQVMAGRIHPGLIPTLMDDEEYDLYLRLLFRPKPILAKFKDWATVPDDEYRELIERAIAG